MPSRRSWCTPSCAEPAPSSAPTRCSTSCTATSSGASRATSSTCPPTARSATSGSGGRGTSPPSRPPRHTSTTYRGSSATGWPTSTWSRSTPTGMVPFVVPDVLKYMEQPAEFPAPESTALWSDAAAWVPWALWQAYGDRRRSRRHYPAMTAHARRVEALLSDAGLWDDGLPVRRLARPAGPAGRAVQGEGRQRAWWPPPATTARSAQVAAAAGILGRP